MHATRAVRAREGWFSHIDLCHASLCITDYDDNVVTRTRPGPPGDTHPRKEGRGEPRFPAGDTPGKFVRRRVSLSVTSHPIFTLVIHFLRALVMGVI